VAIAGTAYAGWQVSRNEVNATALLSADAAPAPMNDPIAQFDATGLTLPRSDIIAGGPPKDGIPSLTAPTTAPVDRADFLQPNDRVIVVTVDDQTRGYPIAILTWHEVINDELAGVPVAVVYCPLCDSVTVVDRRIGGKTLEFGISGLLHNSNVLLYDRTDNALWSQLGFRAVSGPKVGRALRHLPWELITFKALRERYAKATVVTNQTGHRRDYSQDPYGDYFATDRLMFPVAHHDARLKAKERVVGICVGDVCRAYPVQRILDARGRTITDQLGGQRVELQADASGGVRIVQAPRDARVAHSFWFAWAAFHPNTELSNGVGEQVTPATNRSDRAND